MHTTKKGFEYNANHSFNKDEYFLYCQKYAKKISYFEIEKVLGTKFAKFLSRLNYWLNKCGRKIENLPGLWIYNSIREWSKQLNCSESTIKRIIKPLEEQNILLSKKVNAKRYDQTKWYSLNYEKLQFVLNTESSPEIVTKKRTTQVTKKRTTRAMHIDPKRVVQFDPMIIYNSRSNYNNNRNNYTNNFYIRIKEEKSYKKKKSTNEKVIDSNKIINQMVKLWNQVFEHSMSPIIAYKNNMNKGKLLSILHNYFNGDLSYWQSYAKMVNSSQFLMGEKETKNNFKAFFSWLLQDSTIIAIKAGEYGIGDRKLDSEKICKQQKLKTQNKAQKFLDIKKLAYNEEFREYIRKKQWYEDGDEYGIGKYFGAYMSSYQLLNDDRYKINYNMILQKYVVKKQDNIDVTNFRNLYNDRIEK